MVSSLARAGNQIDFLLEITIKHLLPRTTRGNKLQLKTAAFFNQLQIVGDHALIIGGGIDVREGLPVDFTKTDTLPPV